MIGVQMTGGAAAHVEGLVDGSEELDVASEPCFRPRPQHRTVFPQGHRTGRLKGGRRMQCDADHSPPCGVLPFIDPGAGSRFLSVTASLAIPSGLFRNKSILKRQRPSSAGAE